MKKQKHNFFHFEVSSQLFRFGANGSNLVTNQTRHKPGNGKRDQWHDHQSIDSFIHRERIGEAPSSRSPMKHYLGTGATENNPRDFRFCDLMHFLLSIHTRQNESLLTLHVLPSHYWIDI